MGEQKRGKRASQDLQDSFPKADDFVKAESRYKIQWSWINHIGMNETP